MKNEFKKELAGLCSNVNRKKFLLAVSGGIDSMVLTDLFLKSKLNFELAHYNYSLRGKESDDDEKFLKKFASANNLKLHVTRKNTKQVAVKNKQSVQETARELRYEWFRQLCTDNHFDFVVTAHHKTDVAETILINQLRGTGMAGLHGIKTLRHNVWRPLLFATRQQIEHYASKNKIKWREDSSNASDDYLRNRIRHHVLPALKKIDPTFEKTFYRNAERIASQENLLNYFTKEACKKIMTHEKDIYKINIDELKRYPETETLLFYLIKDFGFESNQMKLILSLLQKQTGKKVISKKFVISRNRQFLLLSSIETKSKNSFKINKNDTTIDTTFFNLKIEPCSRSDIKSFSTQKNVALFDASALTFPLTIRPWKPGDLFHPFGMKGKKKKISDLITDSKLNRFEKNECYVLTSKNEIAWVINLRTDERFRITDQTTSVLKFTYTKLH